MRKTLFALAAAAVLTTAAPGAAPDVSGKLTLERVVLVQRHGVRAPTKPPETYARYASQPWPAWPVGPGELTPHGADNVRFGGTALRAHYAQAGLLPANGCPSPEAVAVWADGADHRTRESGQALVDGAFPGCGLIAQHGPDGKTDPMFDAIDAGVCPVDPRAAQMAVAVAAGDLDATAPARKGALDALYAVLTAPDQRRRCDDDKGTCFVYGHNAVNATEPKIEGPLATATTLAENLMLEYTQGMPADAVGWGRADAQAISQIMPLHNMVSAWTRRSPYIASHRGVVLAHAVLAALQGEAQPPFPASAKNAVFVAIDGHDTNLSNLAGILGIDWTLPEQPDNTPPGGTLAFEVWRDEAGAKFIKLVFFYETMEQLREGRPLDAAHPLRQVDIPLSGCVVGPTGVCPLASFRDHVVSSLPTECDTHDKERGP